jgi:LacI family transcriptional regulator
MPVPEAPASVKNLAIRTTQLLRVLVTNNFFGSVLPPLPQLVQAMRLPKMMVSDALEHLGRQGLLEAVDGNYRRDYSHPSTIAGRVWVLTQTNLFSNSYGVYQDFLIGIADVLATEDLEITLLHEVSGVEARLAAIQESASHGPLGVVLLGQAEPEVRAAILEAKLPGVICGNMTFEQNDLGAVCSDNFGGMRAMVKKVIEANHTAIAYYTTSLRQHDGFNQRWHGYREAMEQANLMGRTELALTENHTATSARQAAEIIMAQPLKLRPTAVVCGCDRDAFELISELQHSERGSTAVMSITGFDNSLYDAISDPALSSVEIHAREIGRIAAGYLLNELKRPQLPVRIVVPTRLCVRDSLRDYDPLAAV